MATAKDIEMGEWIMFNRQPYKVKRKDVITAGTHSHSKLKFTLQGLFTPGEKTNVWSHHDQIDMAELEMKTGQVISVSEGKCQVMDGRTYEIDEATVPADFEVKEGYSVQYVKYDGKCSVINVFKATQQ